VEDESKHTGIPKFGFPVSETLNGLINFIHCSRRCHRCKELDSVVHVLINMSDELGEHCVLLLRRRHAEGGRNIIGQTKTLFI